MICPELDVFDRLVGGELDEPTRRLVSAHSEHCSTCSAALDEVRRNLELLPALRAVEDGSPLLVPQDFVEGYRMLEEIGRGGMGVVYRAQQLDPERFVALKLLSPAAGVDLAHGLRREAHALARLQHPGIAVVHATGTTRDGRAFVAMELIEGLSLVRHANARELDRGGRLALFLALGEAVAHAHQRGVLHCDLKSSNVLVTTDGSVKVLDFGLARLLDGAEGSLASTLTRGIAGTVPYMSPEALRGEAAALDVRSDVYSLGVVMYELLVGRLPYDLPRNLVAAARIVTDEPPVRPSHVAPTVRGDLETIVLKALAKDPDERYGTASALVDDVRRLLDGLPIAARPPSLGYHLRRLVARHPLSFATGATVFVAAVVVAVWMGALYERAARDAAQAKESNGLLGELLTSADPHSARGADFTVRELLDEFAADLPERLPHQPEIEADLLGTLAGAYRSLGLPDDAEPLLDRAITLRGDGTRQRELAKLVDERAWVRHEQGRYEEGEQILLDLIDDWGGPEAVDPVVARAHQGIGDFARHRGDGEAAERHARAAAALYEALGERLGGEWIAAQNLLSQVLADRGATAEAEEVLSEALAAAIELRGERHPTAALMINNLAYLEKVRGDLDSAQAHYEKALELSIAVFGEEHPEVARLENNLGELFRARGDLARAESHHRSALAMRRRILAPDHPDLAQSLNNLSLTLAALGQLPAASELLEECISILDAALSLGHRNAILSRINLAALARKSGDLAGAESICRDALAVQVEHHAGDHPMTADTQLALAKVLALEEDAGAAAELARSALEMNLRLFAERSVQVAEARAALGEYLLNTGEIDEGIEELPAGYGIYAEILGPEHRYATRAATVLAEHYDGLDADGAAEWREHAGGR